ncbi:MAG: hypothetical protein KJ587_00760 [Alphaproteobacteria bacterium]|nr:hypothetical protein [Alphaproteobacteria bacterium]
MAIREELIGAIDMALSGDWEATHKLVQKHGNDRRANLFHATLHRQQGDNDNAMHWYRRAGIAGWPATAPEIQLAMLRDELQSQA